MEKTLLLAVLAMVLAGCAPGEIAGTPAGTEPIVFGAMFPLTGDATAYGEPLSRQLQLAVDEINTAGINGKKVEVKLEDSKCNPKDGATAAKKLIEVDKVKVIFGGACSGETLGAAPIAEQAKVILISPSATSPDITNAGDYIFRTAPSDAYAGKVAADKAIAMGFKKAAVVHETTDYAQGLKNTFQAVFKEKGEIVAVESFASDSTDFKTQLLKVKAAAPDVIYIVPQAPAKGVLLIKQLREQGIDTQLMTAEVLIGRDVVKESGKDMEGLIGVEAAFDEKGAVASKILSDYKAKYGDPPFPFYQAAMRDAFHLVAGAVKKAGYDSDAIKKELYATKDWEGAIGKLTMDANGEPILAYSVKKIVNGQLAES
ncbi:ABC transporter substrate-binding protein [Candidatus Woesearchaeota archaeon]|nr:ABC transporter substrate-binding protein [Candidatus Woesearchaeota archaeon]